MAFLPGLRPEAGSRSTPVTRPDGGRGHDNDQQEELVVNFTGYGLYSYDPIAGWRLLNILSPNAMALANLFT